MGTGRHLIARQTIEIVAADRAEAETLAARTSRAADRFATAVERSLDAVADAGLDLRIDRLELDLGPCDPSRWEEALADGIRETLAGKVAEAVDRGEAVHRDPAKAALLLLGEFARSGRLPWWAAPGDSPGSAIDALASAGCEADAVRAILATPEAIERLVHQLEEPSLAALVRLARPELADGNADALADFATTHVPHAAAALGSARASRAAVWRAILAEAASGEASDFGTDDRLPAAGGALARFGTAVSRRLGIDLPAGAGAGDARRPEGGAGDPARQPGALPTIGLAATVPVRLAALARANPMAAAAFDGLAALATQLDARGLRTAEAVLDRESGPAALPALVDVFVAAGAIRQGEAERWRAMTTADKVGPSDEPHDAVSVANSGMALLWPFLPQFFGTLGLLEGEQFRDAPAQHRAATLMHYLASGEVSGPEHDVPLAKVLCGIELDAVHDPGEPLDAFEVGSADALLEAVLGHAPMLGRISVAGLREAFLMWPGLLSTRDGHWLLRVERRTIDILLDRLPWTFAWVRLPWMAQPLQVEW